MIGIAGAGISGLALGSFLEERGLDFRIWERASRAGGVIRSSRVDGHVLDHGPQRTRVTAGVRKLIERAGFADGTVSLPGDLALFVYSRGKLCRVPFRWSELPGTGILSLRGKLRLLLEPFTRGATREETVDRFFIRKFGDEAYSNLLGPLFGGLYGSDPADLLVRHSLAPTLEGMGIGRSILMHFARGAFTREATPPAVSFPHGMQQWVEALALSLGDRVTLGAEVTAIRRVGSEWEMEVGGRPERMEQLVMTIPADRAAHLLRSAVPEVSRRLASLRYNDLAVVHLHGEGPTGALGYQVAYGESLRTRGVTWNAAAFGRDGVYTAFLGGARDPTLLSMPEDGIGRVAEEEFRHVTGARTRVLATTWARIPSWDRSWTALEGMSLPPGLHLCSNYESRVGIPGRVDRAAALARELGSG